MRRPKPVRSERSLLHGTDVASSKR
jgi:hypothetical protein